MITGCGGNDTTCSRRSISGRSRSTNGTRIVSPAFERPRVAAEPLDDAGARLRHDPDRPRTATRTTNAARRRARSCGAIAHLLLVDERGRALDLGDLDARRRARAPAPRSTRGPTTPRRRSDPPAVRVDALDDTSACAPTSAAVPVRMLAGMRRCGARPAAGSRADASEATMNTISWTTTPEPESAMSAAATAASATGPRKKSPGVKTSPIRQARLRRAPRSASRARCDRNFR